MKKSLENLMKKVFFEADNRNEKSIEGISDEFALQIRGGDREYIPMYESSSEMEWGKVSILLDNLK
ncbi:hypothetical protein GCM10011514_43100 [Emticicia aquatilis]|uniref:Uncharacterized protein n=2 Tax=Emticicia aquatilis TaxID=1537369 RepID=A0A916Z4R2_9BACT|nr:hypothetical protein GCM10011514_43100 [Emticicia aquatilis]